MMSGFGTREKIFSFYHCDGGKLHYKNWKKDYSLIIVIWEYKSYLLSLETRGKKGKNSGNFGKKVLCHNHKIVFMVFLMMKNEPSVERLGVNGKNSGHLAKYLYHNHKLVFMVFHKCIL